MDPGHSPARRVSSLGPGRVPSQGGRSGAGDRLVLDREHFSNKDIRVSPHLRHSSAGCGRGKVFGEDVSVHVLLLTLRSADGESEVEFE